MLTPQISTLPCIMSPFSFQKALRLFIAPLKIVLPPPGGFILILDFYMLRVISFFNRLMIRFSNREIYD